MKRLRDRSPHLAGALSRAFAELNTGLFEQVFEFAIANGGDTELGYQREPGVSFNPRCARLGLIVLEGFRFRTPEESAIVSSAAQEAVAGAILSSTHSPFGYDGECAENLSILLQLALSPVDPRVRIFDVAAQSNVAAQYGLLIRAALALDLSRHAHQVSSNHQSRPPVPTPAFLKQDCGISFERTDLPKVYGIPSGVELRRFCFSELTSLLERSEEFPERLRLTLKQTAQRFADGTFVGSVS